MHELSKITIIGTGRVAKSLASIFYQKGTLNEIYGRKLDRAKQIILGYNNISMTTSLDFKNSQSDIFIICVSDSSISKVAQQLSLPTQATLLHTSGTVDLSVFSTIEHNYGILYPVQTFSNEVITSLQNVPILIDSNDDKTCQKIRLLANTLSQKVYQVPQGERELLHISAVFASNFTNRMIHASQEILSQTQLPLDLLEPLIYQSVNNALLHGPQKTLTGPAKRDDQLTINKHTALLSSQPELKAIYQILTAYILNDNK